jgi:hypothetical protein
MAYPIITLIFALLFAFMAYRSTTLETGSETAPPVEQAEASGENADESADGEE